MRRKHILKQLQTALAKLESVPVNTRTGNVTGEPRVFPNASFNRIGCPKDDPLPQSESDVTAFIRRRTRVYLQSWVIPLIQEAIAELDKSPRLSREDREYYRANPDE